MNGQSTVPPICGYYTRQMDGLGERIIQFHEKKIRQIEKSDLPEA